MKFQAVGRTGLGHIRSYCEDAILINSELRFVSVLDGSGGPESGSWAAEALLEAVRRHLAVASDPEHLLAAVKEVRTKLVKLSGGESPQRGFSATFAAAIFGADAVTILNAGDVQAFRFPSGGAPVALLKQHLFINLARERFPEITAEQVEQYKSVITQTMLYPENAEYESTRIPIELAGLLLICTDGIYSYVALEAVERAWEALSTPTLEQRADVLEQMILAGEARDNYAFVLISCG